VRPISDTDFRHSENAILLTDSTLRPRQHGNPKDYAAWFRRCSEEILRKIMAEGKACKADAGPAADCATTTNHLDAHKTATTTPDTQLHAGRCNWPRDSLFRQVAHHRHHLVKRHSSAARNRRQPAPSFLGRTPPQLHEHTLGLRKPHPPLPLPQWVDTLRVVGTIIRIFRTHQT
jgi:hypothetical protein